MNKSSPRCIGEDFFYKPLLYNHLLCQYFSYGMNLGNTGFPVYIYPVCKGE
jgi:hypothetical protein